MMQWSNKLKDGKVMCDLLMCDVRYKNLRKICGGGARAQKVQFREGPPSLRAHDAMGQQAKGWKSDV